MQSTPVARARRVKVMLLATLLLVAAVIAAALVVLRPHALSRAWAASRPASIRHATRRRLVGLPYQTITLSVRSTPSGDAALLKAMADLPLTRMVRIGYRAHDGSLSGLVSHDKATLSVCL